MGAATSFDALSLSAVVDEIGTRLVGGRVQKVVFPDETSAALELYAPGQGRQAVLLSAHPETGRVQLLPRLPARGIERDTPFTLLTRKHLRNARLRAVRQPRLERILELDCESRDDAERLHGVVLIVEAMGRRGNLVLVGEDGAILDAVRRSPPSRNPRRPVLPHLRYAAPPAQDRLFPEQISPEALAFDARDRSGPLARFLSDRLAGLSPLAGRELAYRTTGSVQTPLGSVTDWPSIVRGIQAFLTPLETHCWQPTLAVDADGAAIDVAPYRLEHLAAVGARLEAFASMSAALSAFYERQAAQPVRRGDLLADERKALLAKIDSARQQTERRVAALEYQLASGEQQRDPLRRAGELLLAYQSSVAAESASVDLDGEHIELDPGSSAVENAQAYFARYRKAREAVERVPQLLDEARNTREYLAELRALVEVADEPAAMRALRREVAQDQGHRASDKPGVRGGAAPPGQRSGGYRRLPLGDGWEALVGATAEGNATVTFDLAQPNDLWLHARGVPGAHVIVRRAGGGGEPPADVVERAAQLAAWHSAARTSGRVEVDAAPRRMVKKIPSAPPGLVRYANERTLRVEAKP
jgi:predicted ribosome quality control (RQC) complex YloA/Tae2 family protein